MHNISEEIGNKHNQYFNKKPETQFPENYLRSKKLHWLNHFASQRISWSPFFLFWIKI